MGKNSRKFKTGMKKLWKLKLGGQKFMDNREKFQMKKTEKKV